MKGIYFNFSVVFWYLHYSSLPLSFQLPPKAASLVMKIVLLVVIHTALTTMKIFPRYLKATEKKIHF